MLTIPVLGLLVVQASCWLFQICNNMMSFALCHILKNCSYYALVTITREVQSNMYRDNLWHSVQDVLHNVIYKYIHIHNPTATFEESYDTYRDRGDIGIWKVRLLRVHFDGLLLSDLYRTRKACSICNLNLEIFVFASSRCVTWDRYTRTLTPSNPAKPVKI